MALEEWEILPDEGFLEIHDDEGKKIFSRKYVDDPRTIFKKNYFICPSQNSSDEFAGKTENHGVPKQLFPLPIQFDPTIGKARDHEIVRRVNREDPVEIEIMPSEISEKVKCSSNIEQVFFKKMKETEKLADMKLDSSPRSSNNMGIQVDPGSFQLDGGLESEKGVKKKKKMDLQRRDEASCEENSGNLNIWKWSLNGVGAICSFGVAAATVCIIILGAKQKNKQSQKLQFHIYTDDKRMECVVRQAIRLNGAISAATVTPITGAHLSLGGFFDGC